MKRITICAATALLAVAATTGDAAVISVENVSPSGVIAASPFAVYRGELHLNRIDSDHWCHGPDS